MNKWFGFMLFKRIPVAALFVAPSLFLALSLGCTAHSHHMDHMSKSSSSLQVEGQPEGDQRISLGLSPDARNAHEAVMREHLEAIHQIVAALSRDDFTQAQEITESQLGFAKHREAMQRQNPEDFPPEYHDLAMAHHHAAEKLVKAIPSKNLNQILPSLEQTLKACVDCHRVYRR
jgi:hypothetical protein